MKAFIFTILFSASCFAIQARTQCIYVDGVLWNPSCTPIVSDACNTRPISAIKPNPVIMVPKIPTVLTRPVLAKPATTQGK